MGKIGIWKKRLFIVTIIYVIKKKKIVIGL